MREDEQREREKEKRGGKNSPRPPRPLAPNAQKTGLKLHLGSVRVKDPSQLASSSGGYTVEGNVLIDPSATIGAGCKVGPNVCIGKDCVLGAGEWLEGGSFFFSFFLFLLFFFFLRATGKKEKGEEQRKRKGKNSLFLTLKKKTGVRVRDSVLLHRVKLHDHSCVSDSIVGWGSSVGQWARVANKAVIGEDCHVKDEVVLNGTVVLPHKELKESQMEPGTIVM